MSADAAFSRTSVILSEAKNLDLSLRELQILRFAQDDSGFPSQLVSRRVVKSSLKMTATTPFPITCFRV